mmetsp:Transcript_10188/g.30672  ORF Transcript_10188/g.30672 Transcript_10188/m.30672 type:complete len:95 (-) Transcript_10188:715-999(-)
MRDYGREIQPNDPAELIFWSSQLTSTGGAPVWGTGAALPSCSLKVAWDPSFRISHTINLVMSTAGACCIPLQRGDTVAAGRKAMLRPFGAKQSP